MSLIKELSKTCLTYNVIALLLISLAATTYLGMEPEQMSMLRPFVYVNSASGTVIRSYEVEGRFYSYVLTCAHVTSYYEELNFAIPVGMVKFDSHGKILDRVAVLGTVIESNEELDYSIISIETEELWPQAVIASRLEIQNLNLFDKVYAIGRPIGQPIWITEGVIASFDAGFKHGQVTGIRMGHSADIIYGNSGGPLFSKKGKLIAINSAFATYANEVIGAESKKIGKTPQCLTHLAMSITLDKIWENLGKEKTEKYFGKV